MTDSTAQPNDSRPRATRPWHPWVGFAEGWLGFAPYGEPSVEANRVVYREPLWALRRAIVGALCTSGPRAVAHI
jgi:hypothetical protein